MVQGRHVTWSVAIVGAGPAGSYLAQLLAKSGASVLLLDTACREKPYLETLSSRARPMHGVPTGASPCASNLSCWGGPEPVERAGILRPWGHDWFVDRSVFDAELRDNAIAAGATCWRAGARRAERHGSGWHLDLHDGRRISARFVVDATGRASAIATKLGARRRRHDSLVGTSITLDCEETRLQHATLVAAAPGGWCYVGPGRRAACAVYFTDADLPEYRALRDPHGLARLLDECLPFATTAPARCGRSWAAFSEILHPAAGDGWLAVGDAAASFDPLSSQGLFRALSSATLAAETIAGVIDTAAYQLRLQVDFLDYLAGRAAVYGRESRWPHQPFWRRRAPDSVQSRQAAA
jgi:flavin-dependent dehydrogenase